LDTHPADIAEPSWNYLFTGGKEIRARLFCELWEYFSPDTEVRAELAFAIECIHAASLILDDAPCMDNASTRRGKPTLHLQFSYKKALLLFHDVMQMVYCIWNEHCPAQRSREEWKNIMKEKMQRLMMGQWYDLEKKGTLLELASLKTGILFECVTEWVAEGVGLDPLFWRSWGNHLGILFQWMDDWKDREEDRAQQNRNAFHEEEAGTLRQYATIWQQIERGIGPAWFHRPFGQYMKEYFTSSIPLPAMTHSDALSHLILPYPISSSISVPPFETTEWYPLLYDSVNRIEVNGRDAFEMSKEDLLDLAHQPELTWSINGNEVVTGSEAELMNMSLIEMVAYFNQNQWLQIKGKRVIQSMIHGTEWLSSQEQKYDVTYQRMARRLWSMDESTWHLQPELVDGFYEELQRIKRERC